jgi:hypothetical protein
MPKPEHQLRDELHNRGFVTAAVELERSNDTNYANALLAWQTYDKSKGQAFVSSDGWTLMFPPSKLKSPEEKFRTLGKGARKVDSPKP